MIKETVPKPANPRFHAAAKSHKLCLDQLIDADGQLVEMETRLEANFDRVRAADDALLKAKEEFQNEKYRLKARVKELEEELRSERIRASKALSVAESTSDAAAGIGRLLHRIVDNDVMETLRLAGVEQRQEARERMRHRSPG